MRAVEMTELLHRELTGKIIGAYYDVYNELSHNYPEFIYENAMLVDLQRRGISCTHQKEYQITYKNRLIGVQRLDVLVADQVVVELKVKPCLTPLDKAQSISYVKTAGCQVGLLFNFGNKKPEFERLYYEHGSRKPDFPTEKEIRSDLQYPEITCQIIGSLFEVHSVLGPGFIHRIYSRACSWELTSRGLDLRPIKQIAVFYRGRPVGEINLFHLLIEDKVMLFPVATKEMAQIRHENLRCWMQHQGIKLGILANFHALQMKPEFMKEGTLTEHFPMRD
jgi:GxxExxY protein